MISKHMTVTMTCMSTKKKFDVEEPAAMRLKNGRYAFTAECPFECTCKRGAFKFCSAADYQAQSEQKTSN
jgi:hypothetical protein